MDSVNKRNKYFYGLGTVGRDMFYSIESMFLMVYLTEVLDLSDTMLAWVGTVLTVMRIFDAFNDPIMGVVVDNTHTRWGKFKPGMLIGAVTSGVFLVLLFTDFGLTSTAYIIFFALIYLGWDLTYGLNDIAYWSMLPALTLNQSHREKMGSFARICANVGMFAVVILTVPLTNMMSEALGDAKQAWFLYVIIISLLMIAFQLFTVIGVREQRGLFKQEEKTTLRGMLNAIFKNDQLLFTVIAMALFMIGYMTTTGLGLYFFKYAYGNEDMYSLFAAILGVSQISALAVFPFFSKRFTRRKLYAFSTLLVLVGYALFFFSPMNMIPIGIAGVLLFVGEAFIQVLMLMFLTDTIEYGQWKFGKRNEAVTFSVQPFINKIGGAIGTGFITLTLLLSGINRARSAADVTSEGLLILKLAMFVVPLICIILGYLVYRWKYKIDKAFYDNIVADLNARGDIHKSE